MNRPMTPAPGDRPEPSAVDPAAPLPGPPVPWAGSEMPPLRDGPPYAMTEMIAAEPHLARRLLGRLAEPGSAAERLATAIRTTLAAGQAVVVTGCGTSEHGALGSVEFLRDAARSAGLLVGPGSIVAAQAFELALDPPTGGLVVGVSHEGGTWATNLGLEAAGRAGARIALLTAAEASPGAALAADGLVLATGELDQAWCHTVGYLSPLLASAAVGAFLAGRPLDGQAVAGLLAAGVGEDVSAAAEAIAGGLADARVLLVVGSGADRVAARELTLKVEEGSWLPSAMRDLETLLHGHLPGTDAETGLVLILADRAGREARVARARGALRACRAIGIRVGAILAGDAAAAIEPELTPLGRIVVPEAPAVPAPVAALMATATPLQVLTERLARARGTNPDPIRRDDPVYRAAAEAIEGA